MIPKKTTNEMLARGIQGLIQETDVRMVSPGSVAHALLGATYREIEDIYSVLDDTVRNLAFRTATGFWLDLWGDLFGVARRPARAGRILREDQSLRFYVRTGTLAQRLPHPTDGNLGRIPSGTTVTAGSVVYTVDRDYDFPASARYAFVGASSGDTGAAQGVGARSLTSHSLGIQDVLVENLRAVSTAADQEGDEEYRFRILSHVQSRRGANEAAIRLAALSVPGVADVLRRPHHMGAGSFRLVVIPEGNRVPVEALLEIRSRVENAAAFGIYFDVVEPRYLPIAVTLQLRGARGPVSPVDKDAVEAQVRRYLGNLRPGETLIINQLRVVALTVTDRVQDVVIQGLEINRAPVLLSNYQLRDDELFVPDDNLANPILVL